ncbi:MAG: universal stress protein [Acidobacteriota bacterium]
MRVLLAMDHSPYSWFAVESMTLRPWPPGTIVRVVSAVETLIPAMPEMWYDATDVFERTQQELIKQAERVTARAVKALAANGLWANSVVRDGNLRQVIIEEAENWNADLIILGSHDHAGIKGWLLGSVEQYVVKNAPCSVEVIRERHLEPATEFAAAA